MLKCYAHVLPAGLFDEDERYKASPSGGWNSDCYGKFLPFEPHFDADGDEADETTCEGKFITLYI
jgi:hypothetical protein